MRQRRAQEQQQPSSFKLGFLLIVIIHSIAS